MVAPTLQSIGPGSGSGTKSRCLLSIRSLLAFASGVWSQLPGLSCPPDSSSTSEPVLDFSMLIVATFPVTRSPECRYRDGGVLHHLPKNRNHSLGVRSPFYLKHPGHWNWQVGRHGGVDAQEYAGV